MYKLSLLFLIVLFTSAHSFISESNLVKPIALVKYKDTIYHCEGVVQTSCGYSIHCGNKSVHCANNIIVEYLK